MIDGTWCFSSGLLRQIGQYICAAGHEGVCAYCCIAMWSFNSIRVVTHIVGDQFLLLYKEVLVPGEIWVAGFIWIPVDGFCQEHSIFSNEFFGYCVPIVTISFFFAIDTGLLVTVVSVIYLTATCKSNTCLGHIFPKVLPVLLSCIFTAKEFFYPVLEGHN